MADDSVSRLVEIVLYHDTEDEICDILNSINSKIAKMFGEFRQICPVDEVYLRKIPVTRTGKFASPLNRYFSHITLTDRIYMYKISIFVQIHDICSITRTIIQSQC